MKKCKVCKTPFEPRSTTQVVCGYQCSIEYSRAKALKNSAMNRRKAMQSLKTRSDHLKEAQTAFNAFIRERDKNDPCISCGRFHTGQYHAGHYRTVGSNPELRFEELNVHKQCAPCNNHKSGNIVEYRIRLKAKIGEDKVDWIEGFHEPKHYTIDEIQEIKSMYSKKLKQLKANNA